MSDYGFTTKDQNGMNAVNAKNPIFGFDMGHQPMAFKTFRFRDTNTYPIQSGNPGTPNPTGSGWIYAETQSSGAITETLLKRKHGYNFRPVGYAVITGTWKISSRVMVTQTQRAGTWGGNYSVELPQRDIISYELTPNQFNHIWVSSTGVSPMSGSMVFLGETDFPRTIWSYNYPKSVMTGMPWGSDGSMWALKTDDPIWVEFDDTYIYIKRKRTWTDCIRRCKFTWRGTTDQDIQERVKATAQFTGSQFDVTVYLCPFPLKELL